MRAVGERVRAETAPLGPLGSLAPSKANLLAELGPRLQCASVPPGVAITHAEWCRSAQLCCSRLRALLGDSLLAVRSSRADEDRPGASQAGRFRSVIGVPPECLQA